MEELSGNCSWRSRSKIRTLISDRSRSNSSNRKNTNGTSASPRDSCRDLQVRFATIPLHLASRLMVPRRVRVPHNSLEGTTVLQQRFLLLRRETDWQVNEVLRRAEDGSDSEKVRLG